MENTQINIQENFVQVTDDYNWASDKISEIQSNCMDYIIQRNYSEGANETSTGLVETILSALNEIVSSVCPEQCNGRGQCINSVCLCDEGNVFD